MSAPVQYIVNAVRSPHIAAALSRSALLLAIAFLVATVLRRAFANAIILPDLIADLGMTLVAFAILRLSRHTKTERRTAAPSVWLLAGVLFLQVAASVAYIVVAVAPNAELVSFAQQALRSGGSKLIAVIVIRDVLLGPLVEEYYFRQALYLELQQVLAKPWLTVVVSAVWFTAIHDPASMPIAFVVGVGCGTLRVLTGRLPACVLAHGATNLALGFIHS
jgi:membrane protease YdiL (CAAX protease family)